MNTTDLPWCGLFCYFTPDSTEIVITARSSHTTTIRIHLLVSSFSRQCLHTFRFHSPRTHSFSYSIHILNNALNLIGSLPDSKHINDKEFHVNYIGIEYISKDSYKNFTEFNATYRNIFRMTLQQRQTCSVNMTVLIVNYQRFWKKKLKLIFRISRDICIHFHSHFISVDFLYGWIFFHVCSFLTFWIYWLVN